MPSISRFFALNTADLYDDTLGDHAFGGRGTRRADGVVHGAPRGGPGAGGTLRRRLPRVPDRVGGVPLFGEEAELL